ncbi:MAG: D-aminoacyl-tRNA deacylase, partial [Deltaproteobacteria bacterium]|nr:D-aminoacyl-tRNA deacylase [Deltaproteobacteria bacterium]
RMNLSLLDTGGALVLVPQFTLYADCRKGRRPSFSSAMAPGPAALLFEQFTAVCRRLKPELISGRFGMDMKVNLINDGPVTLMLDSAEIGF